MSGGDVVAEYPSVELTEKERRLVRMIRELGFGTVTVHVADGQPVRAEEVRKSIKF